MWHAKTARLLVVLVMVLGASAVGILSTLTVRSLTAGTASAGPSVPNPGHSYAEVGLPADTWPSLDADRLDGYAAGQFGGEGCYTNWTDATYAPVNATVFVRRWFGPAAAPGQVQWDGQLETLGAVAPDKTTTTLDTGENYIHGSGWAADVARAYFSTKTSPFKLIRYNPADDSKTVYTADTGISSAAALCITGGKVYVVNASGALDRSAVNIFNTSDSPPTLVSRHVYENAGDGQSDSITTDGTYLYVGTTTGKVLLIRISDMALVYTLTCDWWIHAIDYNPADGKVYAVSTTPTAYKITRTGETLSKVEHNLSGCAISDDITFDDTYLWIASESTDPGGQLIRIPLAAFDSHELITAGPPGAMCYGVFADSDGDHIWAVWRAQGTDPGQLTRLKTSDLSTERIWFASGEIYTNEVVQYDTHKYLVTTFTSPVKVINLTNPFPNLGIEKPSSGSNYSYWASIRPFAETTPGVSISELEAYTDGANGLGTGWSAYGGIATEYTEPTGTEEETGDVLNTTNYPTLEAAPVDIFGWTSGSPKALDGSLTNPDTGDVGVAEDDYCFLVIQLAASSAVAEGLSNAEVLTVVYQDGDIPVLKTATVQGRTSVHGSASLAGAGTLAVLAGGVAAAFVGLSVAAWYARRRAG